jgi:hypothetical protein
MSDTISSFNLQQNNFGDEQKEILLAQIRECFGRVVYSHKTHEKQADIFRGQDTFWTWAQIVLSVVASGSFLATFSDLFGCDKWFSLLGAVLTALLAAINLYFKNFSYGAELLRHKETAIQLWNIREAYISLITDLTTMSICIEKAKVIRDELQNKLLEVYKNAPQTTTKAYAKAQNALKFKEDLTFLPNEIDMFLPDKLQLKSKKEGS